MMIRKVLKDSLTKGSEFWDFIGKLLAACRQSDMITHDNLHSVCISISLFMYSCIFVFKEAVNK